MICKGKARISKSTEIRSKEGAVFLIFFSFLFVRWNKLPMPWIPLEI